MFYTTAYAYRILNGSWLNKFCQRSALLEYGHGKTNYAAHELPQFQQLAAFTFKVHFSMSIPLSEFALADEVQ